MNQTVELEPDGLWGGQRTTQHASQFRESRGNEI